MMNNVRNNNAISGTWDEWGKAHFTPEEIAACDRHISLTIATEDDLKSHRLAMEEYERGKTISHNDINWD